MVAMAKNAGMASESRPISHVERGFNHHRADDDQCGRRYGSCAADGADYRREEQERKKQAETTRPTRPVRPPAATPAADST